MKQTPSKTRRRRWIALLVVAGILMAGAILLKSGCSILWEAVSPGPPSAEEGTCGSGTFLRVDGVGVLTVWGTPEERGYAHGWLLARPVLDMVDVVCGTHLLLSDTEDYGKKILPLIERFVFEKDDEAELEGILAGVKARLGEEAVLSRIGRPLTLAVLAAVHLVAGLDVGQ